MNAPTPPPLCSYVENQELPACPYLDQGNGYCERHNGPRFAVCGGCPNNHGTHLCSCGTSLCGTCTHHPPTTQDPTDVGWHGPNQTYAAPSESASPDVTRVREDLTEAVVLSRRRAEAEGLDEYATAARIVHDLGTTVMLTLLSGMVGSTPGGTPS